MRTPREDFLLAAAKPTTLATEIRQTFNMTLTFPDGDELVMGNSENHSRRLE